MVVSSMVRLRWTLAVALVGILWPGIAQAESGGDGVCAGYEKSQLITRLAVRPFAKKPAADKADLAAAMTEHEAELRAFLESRELGHIADELIAALQSGDGVTERALVPGETFEWMITRRKGVVEGAGPRCLATKKEYGAFEVTIRSRSLPANPPQPNCDFEASGNCADRTLSAEASAAAAQDGITVTLSGNGDRETILSGGERTWSGPYENRFRSTYTFTGEASREVTGTETSYTFVIPKVCVNLALAKVETREIQGEATHCKKTETVEPCPAPDPSCALTLSVDELRVGKQVEINATGHWDQESVPEGLKIEVSDGTKLGPELPAYYDATEPGIYTVTCTATNEAGKTATDTATFEVTKPGWTVRFFGSGWNTDDEFMARSVRPNGVQETTKLSSGSGEGFGVSVEYAVKEKIGLEAALLYGSLDSRFTLDLDNEWESDENDFGVLALTFGPNFHLTPDSKVDFYIGPFIGFASIDEPTFRALGETFEVDAGSEFVWGAQLGLDIPFNEDSPWAFHLGLRYMGLSVDDLDLDPIIGSAGFAYRF